MKVVRSSTKVVLIRTDVDLHVLIFRCIYIAVERGVVPPLFFKEIAIELQVEIRGVNLDEVSTSLIFKN